MGEINFSQCAVAFLDILGFRAFIKAAEKPGSKQFTQFCRLQDVITQQLEISTDDLRKERLFPRNVELKVIAISDSFVLSAPIDNDKYPSYSGLVAVAVKTIQLAHQLLNMGFLMRGGIAIDSVYRTPTNIFGTGYQDAYENESGLAKTPRACVLLHLSAVDRLESDRHLGYPLKAFPIFMREGGQFILDTLHLHWSYVGDNRACNLAEIFNGYKANIEQNLSKLDLGSPRDKWEWMAKLFNAKQRASSELRDVPPIHLDKYSPFAFGPTIEQPETTFIEAFGQFMGPRRYVKSFNVQGGSENGP